MYRFQLLVIFMISTAILTSTLLHYPTIPISITNTHKKSKKEEFCKFAEEYHHCSMWLNSWCSETSTYPKGCTKYIK